MFIDGHATHLTMKTSVLCSENQIILYVLPPNTTHILQPSDVSVFKALKTFWRQAVLDFQRQNPYQYIEKKHVAPLLLEVLRKISKDCISNGFRACGICPFNPSAIDCSKLLKQKDSEDLKSYTDIVREWIPYSYYKNALEVMEKILGADELKNLKSGNCNISLKDVYEKVKGKCCIIDRENAAVADESEENADELEENADESEENAVELNENSLEIVNDLIDFNDHVEVESNSSSTRPNVQNETSPNLLDMDTPPYVASPEEIHEDRFDVPRLQRENATIELPSEFLSLDDADVGIRYLSPFMNSETTMPSTSHHSSGQTDPNKLNKLDKIMEKLKNLIVILK